MRRRRARPPDIASGALSTRRSRRNGFAVRVGGKPSGMRFGNLEVRPLGGGLGCLLMVLFSVVASVVLTVLINLLLR
jgi:hypothetical protein